MHGGMQQRAQRCSSEAVLAWQCTLLLCATAQPVLWPHRQLRAIRAAQLQGLLLHIHLRLRLPYCAAGYSDKTKVKVNRLLGQVRAVMGRVADFGQVAG